MAGASRAGDLDSVKAALAGRVVSHRPFVAVVLDRARQSVPVCRSKVEALHHAVGPALGDGPENDPAAFRLARLVLEAHLEYGRAVGRIKPGEEFKTIVLGVSVGILLRCGVRVVLTKKLHLPVVIDPV